jgi:hypothetical protein
MGRPSKGPRLRLQKAKDRQRLWIIRDGQKTFGTGCPEGDLATAELKLTAYIAEHHPELSAPPPLIGVYLLMKRGKVVYIGSSLDTPNRVARHRGNGRPFDQVFYLVTTADQRTQLEAILIKAIKPAQNKVLPTRGSALVTEVGAILTSSPTVNGKTPPTILPSHEDYTHADQ